MCKYKVQIHYLIKQVLRITKLFHAVEAIINLFSISVFSPLSSQKEVYKNSFNSNNLEDLRVIIKLVEEKVF